MPRIKIRIESLSDMVFGLALSIGSLFLILNLTPNVSIIFTNILYFGFGFAIIIMTWLGYSRTISLLPAEVPSALFLNLALLFCVAIEPYLLYVLFTFQTADIAYYSSTAYAVDIGMIFLILAGLSRLVIRENTGSGNHQVHPLIVERFKQIVKLDYIIGGLFLASALPIFWINTPIGFVRFLLWYSSFAFFFFRRKPKAVTPENPTKSNDEASKP
jgi:hypothetical protein